MCLRHAQSKIDTCSKDSQCFQHFGFNATCTEAGFCTNITHAEDIGSKSESSDTNWGLVGAGIAGIFVVLAGVILIYRRRQRASAAVAADDTDEPEDEGESEGFLSLIHDPKINAKPPRQFST